MVSKLSKSIILVVVLALMTTGVVFAQDETRQQKVRYIGEITSVNPGEMIFSLHTLAGDDVRFTVVDHTRFRSRDGSIKDIDDLTVGMRALVMAAQDEEGSLIALMVAATEPGDLPELMRSSGGIASVDLAVRTFTLETKEGVSQQFAVGSRTRYKSRDGSVNDLTDLEPGMLAMVVAVVREDEAPMALLVGAAKPPEPPHRFTVFGEITNVIPGQQIFDLQTRRGEPLTFSVVERTVFRSRDGSIKDIHDLKNGMNAVVVGVKDNEGSLIALVVAVVDLEDLRDSSELNDRSSTINSRYQGNIISSVDDSTVSDIRDEDIGR